MDDGVWIVLTSGLPLSPIQPLGNFMASVPAAGDAVKPSDPADPSWLVLVDRWAARWGDRLNPILIKETRQALKSRQFVVTFSVLLVAALAWTVVGSLSMMPHIYVTPSAPRMLIGYYVVLAVPMLLVVPLAAYRSLENEIDDGTLELLSITTLSPWQIVLGKLASAMLQMLLYFVVIFPCVAYAYNLRGVDLPSIAVVVASLLMLAILLTIVALFLAPLARTRSGRIVTLLVLLAILLSMQFVAGSVVIEGIDDGTTIDATGALGATLFLMLPAAAAAEVSARSARKS